MSVLRPVLRATMRPVLHGVDRRYGGPMLPVSSSGASDFSSGKYLKDMDGDFILDLDGDRIPVM